MQENENINDIGSDSSAEKAGDVIFGRKEKKNTLHGKLKGARGRPKGSKDKNKRVRRTKEQLAEFEISDPEAFHAEAQKEIKEANDAANHLSAETFSSVDSLDSIEKQKRIHL